MPLPCCMSVLHILVAWLVSGSGLGFSEPLRNSVQCSVTGNYSIVFEVFQLFLW